MKKWTVLASIMLAATLGGAFWFVMHQRQEVPATGAALPETDVSPDEFETDRDLGDTDGLLEEGDDSLSAQMKNQEEPDSTSGKNSGSEDKETLVDPDEDPTTTKEPIVIEDRDGMQSAPMESSTQTPDGP